MRRLLLAVMVVATLAGCANREVRHVKVDGIDCVVTHSNLNGNESEPNCDWNRP